MDPDVAAIWRAPEGVAARVLDFDARAGGGYKLALAGTADGGSAQQFGTLESKFVGLIAHEKIAESIVFCPRVGPVTAPVLVTAMFTPIVDGTKVSLSVEKLPSIVVNLDGEIILASVLKKLANLLE